MMCGAASASILITGLIESGSGGCEYAALHGGSVTDGVVWFQAVIEDMEKRIKERLVSYQSAALRV